MLLTLIHKRGWRFPYLSVTRFSVRVRWPSHGNRDYSAGMKQTLRSLLPGADRSRFGVTSHLCSAFEDEYHTVIRRAESSQERRFLLQAYCCGRMQSSTCSGLACSLVCEAQRPQLSPGQPEHSTRQRKQTFEAHGRLRPERSGPKDRTQQGTTSVLTPASTSRAQV